MQNANASFLVSGCLALRRACMLIYDFMHNIKSGSTWHLQVLWVMDMCQIMDMLPATRSY